LNHDRYPDEYIAGILADARTIAIVGASAVANRPSAFAMKYLLGKGYQVIPVNPNLAGTEVQGQRAYAALADVPGPVDIVDIFRNPAAAHDVVREAIALKDKLGLKVIWMQLGVRNEEAAREAEAAGLKVVMNRCTKIEYGRLSGEIGWSRRARPCDRREAGGPWLRLGVDPRPSGRIIRSVVDLRMPIGSDAARSADDQTIPRADLSTTGARGDAADVA
jgi:predicted CoA-binding protein